MNTSPNLAVACALGLLVALAPSSARAADDAAALYKKGVAALGAGKTAQACVLFSKSVDLSAQLSSLYELASCQAQQDQPTAALEHYHAFLERYAAASNAEQLREAAHKRAADHAIAELEKKTGELSFVLPPGTEGSIVRLDGRVIPFLNNVRVDPGEHVALLEMPNDKKVGTKVSAAAGEKKTVQLESGEKPAEPAAAPAAAAVAPDPAPPPPTSSEPKKEAPPPAAHGGGIKASVVILGVLGVAGIATGSVFGAMAMGKASTVDAHCVDVICDAQGQQAGQDGRTLGWISTGAFAVGVIGVAAAVIILATGDSSSKTASGWQPLLGRVVGAGRAW